MFDRLSNFIKDDEFKITIYNNQIHIINYTRIISLEKNYISIYINNKKIIIKGRNLSLRKLLDNEMLIDGQINNIEVVNE